MNMQFVQLAPIFMQIQNSLDLKLDCAPTELLTSNFQ